MNSDPKSLIRVGRLAACSALLAATPGFAADPAPVSPSLFAQFERLCLSTRGHPGALGKPWTPAGDLHPLVLGMYGGPTRDIAAWVVEDKDGEETMVVTGVRETPQGSARVCTVGGPEDTSAGLALSRWAGSVAPPPKGEGAMYKVIDTAQGRRAATPEEDTWANAARIQVVTWASIPGDTTILNLVSAIAQAGGKGGSK